MTYPKPYRPRGRTHYYFAYVDARRRRRIATTHCLRHTDADDYVRDFIDARTSRTGNVPFSEYQKPYFIWPTCPHLQRLLKARKSIGRTHVEKCRGWIDRWVLLDASFCGRPMNRITRGDILDLRDRVCADVRVRSVRAHGEGLATINRTISAVGVIFREACFRGDIPTNPAQGVGDIGYERESPDVLTLAELHLLFDRPWTDALAYSCFRVAAGTGMRCGEVLALQVEQLQGKILTVDHAWKHRGDEVPGAPKWGKVREIVVAEHVGAELRARIGQRTQGPVFAWADGSRLSATWWRQAFAEGLREREIVAAGRRLTPHGLRHALNTHLLEAGLEPMRIQFYLWGTRAAAPGQAGIGRVQRGYTHFQAAMTEAVALAIERLYGVGKAEEKRATG